MQITQYHNLNLLMIIIFKYKYNLNVTLNELQNEKKQLSNEYNENKMEKDKMDMINK